MNPREDSCPEAQMSEGRLRRALAHTLAPVTGQSGPRFLAAVAQQPVRAARGGWPAAALAAGGLSAVAAVVALALLSPVPTATEGAAAPVAVAVPSPALATPAQGPEPTVQRVWAVSTDHVSGPDGFPLRRTSQQELEVRHWRQPNGPGQMRLVLPVQELVLLDPDLS